MASRHGAAPGNPWFFEEYAFLLVSPVLILNKIADTQLSKAIAYNDESSFLWARIKFPQG